MNKENIAATPTFTRKRAKSFSTPPSSKPVYKAARGILKANIGDDAHTIAFIPIHSPSKKTTASAEKRRKSLSRRVSFASHASVRLFEKPGEASPQEATPRRSTRLSPAKSPIRRDAQESPTRSQKPDDSNDELTMDLTTVFSGQSANAQSINPSRIAENTASDSEEDDQSAEDDEAVAEDDTAAMDLTDIVPLPSKLPATTVTPKRSMLPIPTRQTLNSPGLVQADVTDEDMTMDMTRIYPGSGPILDPASPFVGMETMDGMDMTRIIGGILPIQDTTDASPSRSRSPNRMQQQLASAIEEEQEADQTMNMDETRIFSVQSSSSSQHEDHTSHTSVTVATEEDSTQRLCEGSVTQADGFTQNMDFANVYNQVKQRSPVRSVDVGFSWGASRAAAETSIMDVSMQDVTYTDETINMDMTQAIPGIVQPNQQPSILSAESGSNEDMSFTQVLPPVTPQRPSNLALSPNRRSSSNRSSRRSRDNTPGLSSGPRRNDKFQATESPAPSRNTTDASPIKTLPDALRTPNRRKSLLDHEVPQFGTPEARVLLEPGSSQRPEFSSTIVQSTEARIAVLQERIQSLTPKKASLGEQGLSPSITRAEPTLSPNGRARVQTPQKTPSRSLLLPYASVSKSTTTTPARIITDSPVPQITLDEFLKMTGVSFLTNLSTTRRRETIALSKPLKTQVENQDSDADKLIAKAYTMPMLEMYQHSCRELNRYIEEGRAMCKEIEADINEQNPEIFDQYQRASPSEKRDLEAKFKALKTMSRLSAKGVWYVWRTNLIDSVLVPLRKNLEDLEKEASQLADEERLATPVFEATRKRYEELKAEAEALTREEEIYNAYDHVEAARLKKSIEEDETEIAATAAEIVTLKAQDAAVQAELASAEAEYQEALKEVARLEFEAEKNRGYTAAELAEFKQTYRDLVDSTGIQIQHVSEHSLDLSLDNALNISVSLQDMSLQVNLSESLQQDVLHSYYTHQLKQSLLDIQSASPPVKESLALVRNQWSAITLLSKEIRHLESAYPVTTRVNEDDNVQITVPILLPSSRTKFVVDLISKPSLSMEECHLEALVCVKYGGLDAARVQNHIQSRLQSQSLAKRASGWLLESLRMPEGI